MDYFRTINKFLIIMLKLTGFHVIFWTLEGLFGMNQNRNWNKNSKNSNLVGQQVERFDDSHFVTESRPSGCATMYLNSPKQDFSQCI